MLDRWPCTWLTLMGYTYTSGEHPADVVSGMLVGPHHFPQLLWRVRDTAWHFYRMGDWKGRVVYEDGGSVFVEIEKT